MAVREVPLYSLGSVAEAGPFYLPTGRVSTGTIPSLSPAWSAKT